MQQPVPSDLLTAPYTIEFGFSRTVGPVIGEFLTGLRDGVLTGATTASGRVLCPALEFEPGTGIPTTGSVPLEPTGTVTSWTWVPARPGDPVGHDFAWALVLVDGADTALFHAVDTGGDADRMHTGMRVRIRWSQERVGSIRDLACFEPVEEEQ
ncbi:OB-fold domain-containing protein [Nocardioides sp. W7]|uniref:Zn-ribbon domain-containing OB-fold protein n=1 Tax=Nocardioides sp. W7 TaxID=2931390 RepID=UPI001FD2A200|nr:OB-fold domain-containing protein [Nocardioides sp. W7]